MLTLFEYLRRRAFEAVIDGTQDALDFLDSQQEFDQSEAAENVLARRRTSPDSPRRPETMLSTSGRTIEGQKGNETLPAPRRRGRPRKDEQQKK